MDTFTPKPPPSSSCGSFRTCGQPPRLFPAMLHSISKRLLSEPHECSLTALKRDLQVSFLGFSLCLTLLNPGLVWTRVQIFNTERVRVH